jgi:hypothetical protein
MAPSHESSLYKKVCSLFSFSSASFFILNFNKKRKWHYKISKEKRKRRRKKSLDEPAQVPGCFF